MRNLQVAMALSALLALAPTVTAGPANGSTLDASSREGTLAAPESRAIAPTGTKADQGDTGALTGVAAVSDNLAWAVGEDTQLQLPVIGKWDGRSWSLSVLPLQGIGLLAAVSADSPSNAVAVGFQSRSPDQVRPLALRWNGNGWASETVPYPADAQYITLSSVISLSPTSAWAVGSYTLADTVHPLTEHWNGDQWQIVTSPAAPRCILKSVSGVATTDVWTVGSCHDLRGDDHTLIEHWNGVSWKRIPSPSPTGSTSTKLVSVLALTSVDVFAGGDGSNPHIGRPLHFVERWDGTAWRIEKTRDPAGSYGAYTSALAGASPTDVWDLGNAVMPPGVLDTMAYRLRGSKWFHVDTPSPGQGDAVIYAASANSPSSVWSVGMRSLVGGNVPMIQHFDGSRWKLQRAVIS